ncbi:acyltransferase family protein [Variovorax sp. RHLX14]|uniref:acyltransferase family protein n=1 Tax=Variovorax sp. RHLX14 TaxID=1259731 RepID=UPI003F4686F7
MNTNGRIHFLDAARAILMFLGIPYHVAMVYRTGNDWEFAISDEHSVLLSYVAEFIHIFRMPLFFMVAGYFAMMMLGRKHPGWWFGGRIFKLGVPLLAAGLLLNPISLMVQDDSAMLLAFVGDHWLAHLWFLPTLIYMCAVLALMQVTPLQRWFELGVNRLVDTPVRGTLMFLLIAGSVSGLGSMLGSRVPDTFILSSTILSALGFLPYLLFGAAMRINRRLLIVMSHGSFAVFAMTLVPLAFAMTTTWGGGAMNIARVFAITIVCFGFARTLLTVCRLLLDHPSKSVRNIADASFTVYLVHFPLLNVFYKLIAPADIPVLPEFVLLVGSVAVVSYLVHRLIARSDMLLLLFNGAPLRRPSSDSVSVRACE